MKFAQSCPVKVIMLGVGGTGGHIAPHMYRLLHSLDRPVRYVIADGDMVEEKNLVRQNFIAADLSENKARVMAERYSSVFGMETEFIPDYVENEEQLARLVEPTTRSFWRHDKKTNRPVREVITELVILIGAVDNNRSRQLCHRVFMQARDLVYIDSGNGEYTGQVVCGIRQKGRTLYKPVGVLYPDVLEDNDDKFPTELSCAEAAVSAPQSIMANVMAATAVLSVVYNILARGENIVRKTTFSTKSVNLRSELAETRRRAA